MLRFGLVLTPVLVLSVLGCGRINYDLLPVPGGDASALVADSGVVTDGNAPQPPVAADYATRYQGVMLVQAFGDAPAAPSGQPTARQASITWLPFTGADSATEYVLVRVARGAALDMRTLPACTETLAETCEVCAVTGSGVQTCTDTNVAPSPQQYDYAVTLREGSLTYSVPPADGPFRIAVPIPPANMALVQRDAANYEMCQLMGRASDPLNKQRCAYTGLGAVPLDTGSSVNTAPLGLPATHYDFGYNLFVARWELGCAWTSASNGGQCGAGATGGDCYGSGAPGGGVGVDGNTYYDARNGVCFFRDAGVWRDLDDAALGGASVVQAVTIDPAAGGNKNPPVAHIDRTRSWEACQALVDGAYGRMRLLRRREFIVASARPRITGEPGRLADVEINALEWWADITVNQGCNTNGHTGVTVNASNEFPQSDLGSDITHTTKVVVIGSELTRRCVSRFGMQDMVGNVHEWVSDQLDTCDAATDICVGGASNLDAGNRDLQGFRLDGVQGPGGVDIDTFAYEDEMFSATRIALPLGLPLVGDDGGNANAVSAVGSALHRDFFILYTNGPNGPSVPSRVANVGGAYDSGGDNEAGRWNVTWSSTYFAWSHVGPRCVLPAE